MAWLLQKSKALLFAKTPELRRNFINFNKKYHLKPTFLALFRLFDLLSTTMSYDRGRGPPSIEGMTSLKVDNLTYRTTVDDLKKVFRAYGDVGDVYIPRDARTNQSRGFAFVRFFERRDAEDAMDRVDGSVLDGREIRVQNAKYGRPQSDYRQRSGGRDRGYNDRSRGRRFVEENCVVWMRFKFYNVEMGLL